MEAGEILAIFIAGCALGVSIWQGYEIRKNYRLLVTPHISIVGDWTVDDPFQGIIVVNKGIGPATITRIEISIENRFFYNPLSQKEFNIFIDELRKRTHGFEFFGICHHMFENGEMISSGEKIPFIWLGPGDKNDLEKIKLLEQIFSNIMIDIEYQSIYGKTYTTKNQHLAPETINS